MIGFGAQYRERELQEWIAGGIITPAQASKIRDARARHTGPGVFTLLASLGGICVALGVVLVVAYNWDRFHRGFKLGGFLLALTLTAEAAGRLPDTWAFVRGATQVLWLFLPLAGIGLMGQVYQLSGEPLRPLLLALALGLPVAWRAGNPVASFLHVAGLGAAAWVGALYTGTWLSLVEGQPEAWTGHLTRTAPRLLGLAALWALAFREAERLLGPKTKRLALLAVLAFVWSLTVAPTPFRVHDLGGQYLIAGSLIALFHACCRPLGLIDELTAEWGTFLGFAALFSATFLWHTRSHDAGGLDSAELAVLAVLSMAALAATLLGKGEPGRSTTADIAHRALILSPALIGLLLMLGAGPKPTAVVANLLALALAARELAEGTASAAPGRISFGILMLGLIIVTRFLDYFGTMLQSGVAFIIAGIGFIALAWVLNKGRTALIKKAEERP